MTEVWMLCLPNLCDPGGEIISIHATRESAREAARRYMAAKADHRYSVPWVQPDAEQYPDLWRSGPTDLEIERHEVEP